MALDMENTTVMEINDVNESGFGINSVTKTLYELRAGPILPDGASGADYVAAVCGAAGFPYGKYYGSVEMTEESC